MGGVDLVLFCFWRRRLNKATIKTGYHVGLHTVDWGLRFMHLGPVIINEYAKIGNNFQVYPQTLIGQTERGKSAKIGNNVTMCPGVKIIGPVKIGDNVVIAANALVVKDIPSNAVVVSTPAVLKKLKQ